MTIIPAQRHDRGFTLVEVLVALAIIILIGSLFLGNIFSYIGRGRDSRRKQDLRSIAQALELYYNDLGHYPDGLPDAGDALNNPTDSNVNYMQKIPADPATKSNYCYEVPVDVSWFKVTTNLENSQDPDILTTPTSCGGNNFNYGISSTNITL